MERRQCAVIVVRIYYYQRGSLLAYLHFQSGKYYHRHRRPNDSVEYNTSPEFHLAKRRTAEEARKAKKRGGGSSRLAAANALAAAAETPLSLPPADTPLTSEDEDEDDEEDIPLATRNRSKQPSVNRIVSPELSDLDSIKAPTPPPQAPPPPPEKPSSSPVTSAQSVTLNGGKTRSGSSQSSPTLARAKPNRPGRPLFVSLIDHSRICSLLTLSPIQPAGTPRWLEECLEATKAAHPLDDFGALPRPPQPGADPNAPPEWRLKCYDCPGKVRYPRLVSHCVGTDFSSV